MGSSNLSIGKVIFIGIELCVLTLVNVLTYYLLPSATTVNSQADSYYLSCDEKYDSYPVFSGVIKEIEAIDYTAVVMDQVGSADINDYYRSADSAEIGAESITCARIRVTGIGGDRWFVADNSTYVYDAIADMYGGITLSKGQNVSFAYGNKTGVEGYDYVYAVKGKAAGIIPSSTRTLSGNTGFVFITLIPSVFIFVFSIVLLFAGSTPKEERSRKTSGLIAASVVMITLAVLFGAGSFGLYTYIRQANKATTRIRAHAPIIYLYPSQETEVNVKLSIDGDLTSTYPLYNAETGWNVNAAPGGLLTDDSGRNYSYLFWEADLDMEPDLSKGFCVKGEDTAAFLEYSLKEAGLTDTEANAFIMYWLPQMEVNEYNVITFQTAAYEDAAMLDISPAPDTVIRVNMLWYPSDSFVDIEAQDLSIINPSERSGFTVVEWGGEMLGE